MDAAYGDLKKARRVKKGLLTRSMNRLRTIVGRGKDAHADTINAARRRARDIVEELDEICKKNGNYSTETDAAVEEDEDGATKPTTRMQNLEEITEEIASKEEEIDQL